VLALQVGVQCCSCHIIVSRGERRHRKPQHSRLNFAVAALRAPTLTVQRSPEHFDSHVYRGSITDPVSPLLSTGSNGGFPPCGGSRGLPSAILARSDASSMSAASRTAFASTAR